MADGLAWQLPRVSLLAQLAQGYLDGTCPVEIVADELMAQGIVGGIITPELMLRVGDAAELSEAQRTWLMWLATGHACVWEWHGTRYLRYLPVVIERIDYEYCDAHGGVDNVIADSLRICREHPLAGWNRVHDLPVQQRRARSRSGPRADGGTAGTTQ